MDQVRITGTRWALSNNDRGYAMLVRWLGALGSGSKRSDRERTEEWSRGSFIGPECAEDIVHERAEPVLMRKECLVAGEHPRHEL